MWLTRNQGRLPGVMPKRGMRLGAWPTNGGVSSVDHPTKTRPDHNLCLLHWKCLGTAVTKPDNSHQP